MKRIFTISLALVWCNLTFAAPSPLFFNAGVITNALPIDATTFLNLGSFTNIITDEFPYSTHNTLYFTNRGTMIGSVGFQLDTILDTVSTPPRRPLSSFYNGNGALISGVDNSASFLGFGGVGRNGFFFGGAAGTASFVKISATNLVNRGTLSVGTVGLMQLTGTTVDIARGSLTAGQTANGDTNFFQNTFFSGNVNRGFFIGNSYVNAFGVEDIYWGAGPFTINLRNGTFGYFPPNGVRTPQHAVQLRSAGFGVGGFFGLIQTLPTTFPADFGAFANVNQFGTNIEIQVVFLKTNFTDTNITAQVRFGSSSIPIFQTRNRFGEAALVEFSTPEYDPVSARTVTNSVYFIDGSAEQTSIVLLTNAQSINSQARPSGYEIATATPFEWLFAQPTNTQYDPRLLFPGNTYQEKDGIAAFYGAYSAKIGRNPESLAGTAFNSNFFNFGFFNNDFVFLPDPTNQAGRIDIKAETLDLSLARIRTEGVLSMNAKHLKGVGAADISAGIINADLGSTNGSLVISNVFPSHFKRVRGDVFAWSAIWNNTETNRGATNNVMFHVLVLDHDLKADFKPTIRDLTLRSTNLVVKDDLTIVRRARFVAENLTFGGSIRGTNVDGTIKTNIVITLTEDALNLHSENFDGVKNFLNESNSVFQGANDAFFGFDTDKGFDSVTNRGTIMAVAPLFKSTRFENSGTIIANQGGSVMVQARTANLSNGKIFTDRDVELRAGELIVTNSTLTAGQPDRLGQLQFGRLVLGVTNLLTDLNAASSNFWTVSDGIILERKPVQGDLLKTEIRTIASANQESQHIWAGEDVGAGPEGYMNNVAVGHLILDLRSDAAKLRFTGAGVENALYVVNLDFQVTTDVNINTSLNNLLAIDDNMRIYYINSNAGDKLETAFPGRIVHVEDFGLLGGTSPLILKAKGVGIVTPNLDGKTLKIGSTYKLKATPGSGQVFANWSGGTNTPDPALTFTMRRNLVLEANFVPNPFEPVKGIYNGLFYDTVYGVKHESSGFITFTVTPKGGVMSGKLISGKAYSFSGMFNSTGHAILNVARVGKTPLTLELQLDLAAQSGQVTGLVHGEHWVAAFVGDRAGSSSVPAGKYTLVIPGGGSNSFTGDGFGTATITAAGAITYSVTLADGTSINKQKASLSKNGQWPFYLPLYNGAGSTLSQIIFTTEPGSSFRGDVSWIKAGNAGFTNLTTVIGSTYTPPATGIKVLNLNNSTVVLRGGNLSAPITNQALIGTGITGTNRLTVSISRTTGLLTGSFLHPDTRKPTQIKGVVLQQQNNARGFFLGTNQSGAVLLEGN